MHGEKRRIEIVMSLILALLSYIIIHNYMVPRECIVRDIA